MSLTRLRSARAPSASFSPRRASLELEESVGGKPRHRGSRVRKELVSALERGRRLGEITCIFVDKHHRGRGVARAGLEGALTQIAHAGGGLVEAISRGNRRTGGSGRFLFSATAELFEQFGFTRGRQVRKHAWILSRVIDAAARTGRHDSETEKASLPTR